MWHPLVETSEKATLSFSFWSFSLGRYLGSTTFCGARSGTETQPEEKKISEGFVKDKRGDGIESTPVSRA